MGKLQKSIGASRGAPLTPSIIDQLSIGGTPIIFQGIVDQSIGLEKLTVVEQQHPQRFICRSTTDPSITGEVKLQETKPLNVGEVWVQVFPLLSSIKRAEAIAISELGTVTLDPDGIGPVFGGQGTGYEVGDKFIIDDSDSTAILRVSSVGTLGGINSFVIENRGTFTGNRPQSVYLPSVPFSVFPWTYVPVLGGAGNGSGAFFDLQYRLKSIEVTEPGFGYIREPDVKIFQGSSPPQQLNVNTTTTVVNKTIDRLNNIYERFVESISLKSIISLTPGSALDVEISPPDVEEHARSLQLYILKTFENSIYIYDEEGSAGSGWWIGGFPNFNEVNNIQRFNFANDLSVGSDRGDLVGNNRENSASSNGEFAWVFGGRNGGNIFNTIQRFEFALDFSGAQTRSSLVTKRYLSSSCSNNDTAWIGGGTKGPVVSDILNSIERLDFATDTGGANDRSDLSENKVSASSINNSNFGYWGGGDTGASTNPSNSSGIDRLEFSNDTTDAQTRGNLVSEFVQMASFHDHESETYGWWAGGQSFFNVLNIIQRTTYSNDTQTAQDRSDLIFTVSKAKAASNSDFGFVGGGFVPGSAPAAAAGFKNTVQRIILANDTQGASDRGDLALAVDRCGSTEDQTF